MGCNRLQNVDDASYSDVGIICPEQHLHVWSRPSDTGIELSQITVIRSLLTMSSTYKALFDEQRFDGLMYEEVTRVPYSVN